MRFNLVHNLLYLTPFFKKQYPNAPDNQQASHDPAGRFSRRQYLLYPDINRQSGNPEQVHHATDKQDKHQKPAATQAIQTMMGAHDQCPAIPGPVILCQKLYRAAAMPQAGIFEGSKLPGPSRE